MAPTAPLPPGRQPLGDAAQTARFAMPLFLQSRADVQLTKTATAKGFLQRRLREIGLL